METILLKHKKTGVTIKAKDWEIVQENKPNTYPELEFISQYLSCGITCEVKENEIHFNPENLSYYGAKEIKLILKPLSDFYDINCPEMVKTDMDIPTQLELVDLCIGKTHYQNLQYFHLQEFLRYGIDVFGLIEQEKAHSIMDFLAIQKHLGK
jgi:hypothetical protein